MTSIITLGSLNSYYSYLFATIIFGLLQGFLSGFNSYNLFTKKIKIPEISKNMFIKFFFNYLCTGIIGLILNIYQNKFYKSKNSNKNQNYLGIKLIYNDYEEEKKTTKLGCYCLLIYTLWIIGELLFVVFDLVFQDLDFWMIEICIITFYSSRLFKTKVNNHHKVAMWLNIIPFILKIISIIIPFLPKKEEEKKEEKKEEDNYTGGLPLLYYICPIYFLAIIPHLLLITLRSYTNSRLKWLMDLKYISSTKIISAYGFIGAIICFVLFFPFYFFADNCCQLLNYNEDCNFTSNNYNFSNYICRIPDINDTNKSNIDYLIYFSNDNNNNINRVGIDKEIPFSLFKIIFFFLFKYFYIMTIKILSPVHVIFSFPLQFFFEKLIMASATMILDYSLFSEDNPAKIAKMILNFAGDIFAIISFLIYLELIVLNFNNYNQDIKENIKERAIKDIDVPQDETICSE